MVSVWVSVRVKLSEPCAESLELSDDVYVPLIASLCVRV
jgi:hypothetical protein